MLGTIIGIGAAAGKAIANNNAKNEQKKENRELMKYQADLNQQQALQHRTGKKFVGLHKLRKYR